MIDSVHGADVGQESLGGADVAGGLVSPDVLLPGLQRQSEAVVTINILGHPDHPPRHVSDVLLLGGEEASMRTTVTQRYSEPLTGAKSNVHTKLSWRLQDGESHQISGTDCQCSSSSDQRRKFIN